MDGCNGIIPEWFHGAISRNVAEERLMAHSPGNFLIRVSESRAGYTLSYRASDRCRHFMIDILEDGHYVIVGETITHQYLQDLIDFHRKTPIMPFNEVLTVVCKQSSKDTISYSELVFTQRHTKSSESLPPTHPEQPRWTSNQSQEELPPQLPYRQRIVNSAALHPSSNQSRLYPSLEEKSVSWNWNTSIGTPPANRPPEIPARIFTPSTEENQACSRTVPAPGIAHISGDTDQSTKRSDVKSRAALGLKNLKKKFLKRSPSQEHTYSEITETHGDNNYQEVAPVYGTSHVGTLEDGVMLYEYLKPPPFAPGY